MAHEIHEHDHAMYGSSLPAWHGLGTVVKGQPTAVEAIRIARLDWDVEKEPVYADFGGEFHKVPGAFVTVRSDLDSMDYDRVLGVVGSHYTPIQNRDAFGIADALIGEGGANFESAGSLKNGRRVWMLAELPGSIKIKDDTIARYLLLHNMHDGSGSMIATVTPVRVVCNNTLTWALKGAKTHVKIRHTKSAGQQVDEARKILGLASETFEQVGERLNELAETRVNPAFVTTYLQHLVPDPANGGNTTRAEKTRNRIRELFTGGQIAGDQVAVNGTAYGLYNAVTQYVDQDRTVLLGGRSAAEARLNASWFGAGAKFREGAMDLMLDNLEVAGYGDALDYVKQTPQVSDDLLDKIEVAPRDQN